MNMWKHTRQINILIPEELLARIDEAALSELKSRSEYIRQVLLKEVLEHSTKDNFTYEDKVPKWLNTNDI